MRLCRADPSMKSRWMRSCTTRTLKRLGEASKFNITSSGHGQGLHLIFCCSQAIFSLCVSLCSGFYRGISPGATGSFATGATYLESTKTWMEHANPNLRGHWSHFIAAGIGIAIIFLWSSYLLAPRGKTRDQWVVKWDKSKRARKNWKEKKCMGLLLVETGEIKVHWKASLRRCWALN